MSGRITQQQLEFYPWGAAVLLRGTIDSGDYKQFIFRCCSTSAFATSLTKGKEIEIKLIARLRKHLGNPKFTALGERLEKVKERHEQGFTTSLEFLKEVLQLAKEVVEAEKGFDPVEERDRAKEALTELFNEAKNSNTHIIVERLVADIDDIVKKVRFPEWQHTTQGERLVERSYVGRC